MVSTALKVRGGSTNRQGRADRSLPWKKSERQAFVKALQETMNYCFDKANEARGLHLGPPANYYEYLGYTYEPVRYHELDFTPGQIGFFRIVDWNRRRFLDEHRNVEGGELHSTGYSRPVEESHAPVQQDWVDNSILQPYIDAESSKPGGACPSLAGYIEDTRERDNDKLRLFVRESKYYRNVAIRRCLIDNPDVYDTIKRRVTDGGPHGGLSRVVSSAPLSNIAINVTVLSRAGNLMVIKRPENTRTYSNSFQLGPHETMNWINGSADDFETCFKLARRALREEVGIYDPSGYMNQIVFSWFGYYLPEAQGYFFAHVQTVYTEDQLTAMVRDSEGRLEADGVLWIEPSENFAKEVLSCWSNGPFDPVPSADKKRIYLPHATISIMQLLRVMRERTLPKAPGETIDKNREWVERY